MSTQINYLEDLLLIEANPSGTFVLNRSLDFDDPSSYSDFATNGPLWSKLHGATQGWTPLFYNEMSWYDTFSGIFEGNGHSIKNLFISEDFPVRTYDYLGLFSQVTSCTIRNLRLRNVDNKHHGTVIGTLIGTAFNYESGTIVIQNCFADGVMSPFTMGGGLIGEVYGCFDIENSFADVEFLEEDGLISGTGYSCGGLIGHATAIESSTIRRCGAIGNLAAYGNVIGGLIGKVEVFMSPETLTVERCFAAGNVKGDLVVSGFIADCNQAVKTHDCYTLGNIELTTTTNSPTGSGLIAAISNPGDVTEVYRCYSAGTITYHPSNSSTPADGMVGWIGGAGSVLSGDNFYDSDTSGISTSVIATPQTTAQMKDIATFSAWDIVGVTSVDPEDRNDDYIWNIVHGSTYPFFSWYFSAEEIVEPQNQNFYIKI
jgi:hypothetical protein